MLTSQMVPARPARWGRTAILGGIAVVIAGASWSGWIAPPTLHARQEPAAAAPAVADATTALVSKQLEMSLRALKMIAQSQEIGAPVLRSSPDTIFWSRQVLEARLYLGLDPGAKTQDVEVYLAAAKGAPHDDRLAAFEEHLRNMKVLEDRYRPLFRKGDLSSYDFAKIETARLQAEIWLSREKSR